MKEWMIGVIRPDFLQGMAAATLCFLLPLRKRPRWALYFLAVLVVFLTMELPITLLHANNWHSPVAYILPVLFPLAAFLLCADGALTEAVYGSACAYATQHVAFCVVMFLWATTLAHRRS